jgi:predicted dehydrogenase
MKFGLVGTGPWAEMAHGPGLLAAEGVDLVGVWGRRPEATASIAARLGVTPYDDYSALLNEVDAVAFAVPPDIQSEMALAAAAAGKHLLLDKPIATDLAAANALVSAVETSTVASVVFFTDRFVDASRTWFDQVAATGPWRGGWLRWLSALQEPGNPFGASPWRQQRGALWDTGPHALSTLMTTLGPVTSLKAMAGEGDLVTLSLSHESGANSSIKLSQYAPPAAACFEVTLWGANGFTEMPPRPESSIDAVLATAAEELVEAALTGTPHEVGITYGARIVELIADAQSQIDAQEA